MRRTAAAVLVALSVTACGSTVQQTTTATQDGLVLSGDGLSVDGATASGGGAAVPGSVGAAQGPTAPGVAVGGTSGAQPGSAPGSVSGPATAPTSAGGVTPARGGGPVQLGFFVTKDLGPATKSLGVDGLSTGDGRRQAEATAKLLNATGGIAGRRVEPVVFEYDVTQDAQSQFQGACSLFYEDNRVVGVVSILLHPVLSGCTEQRGAVLVTSGNRAPSQQVLDTFRHTVVPSQMPLETVVSTQVAALVEQGWFRPSTPTEQVTIGLLFADAPDFAKVPALADAALKRAGLSLEISQAMPVVDDTSQVAAASSAGSNGVLRFRGAGVNRALVVDKSGQALAYFAIAAQNQSYYPRFGISSLELPALLPTALSERQLEGAAGIGFAPLWDLPLKDQPPANANVKACLSAMQGAGEDMQVSATRATALTTCDSALTLAAAWRSGDISRSGFVGGLRALGRSHPSVMTLSADFATGHAPASSYRALTYAAGCDCFAYSGAGRPVRR